ncbi:MAG TPA: cyclic pyranopterin monophosphate synthase MoaC [Methanospirillum sp.]|uniref:cyclic pyranopterin monophosphate synthase MoaC n=1 Tax=Methanospirillum sp. TaxID=45200 RepID=UPI002BB5DBE9|nr:cyclic pyranopterin monophosphate synthase MoaC [Methanospirillum sp.]HWQ64356.1 cyclic pyranopterin monophosphate synthase MoaC [Methanospirillum sp.]
MTEFTHITDDRVRMVDVSSKNEVSREALASGTIILRPETLKAIATGSTIKGNVLATARVAATLAIKDTFRIIPMCHNIPVHGIDIDFEQDETSITARVKVISSGKTGVEMEALVGVSTALLTIWDMVKSAEKDDNGQYPVTLIKEIRVDEKQKGQHP